MKSYKFTEEIPVLGSYDVIVAGGGVAGVAAAVSAARMGKSVLLIEKTITLGGLATIGLINYFVPMCNGRGTKIIKGMAQELFDLSIKYGFDTVPSDWKDGDPPADTKQRYVTRFSIPIFIAALTELLKNEGVDILFDTVVTKPVMEDNTCVGVIVENKTGREMYCCKMIVDVTGDSDILYRAGVPTIQGCNFQTFLVNGVTIKTCEEVIKTGDFSKLTRGYDGGNADLYGGNHPEGHRLWKGTNARDVTDYVVESHINLLNNIRNDDRNSRELIQIPTMPQFRTTRCIDGDYVFTEDDVYKHFDDSIGAICDFDRRNYLYEIPFGTLVKTGFPNMITAGRSASGRGYGWDLLRVIPPAIITGQAAGVAVSMAIDSGSAIYDTDIKKLQKTLEEQDVMIHFDDSLIVPGEAERVDIGHI